VEDIGYQKATVQEMERAMLPVIPLKETKHKRRRLQVVAPYIRLTDPIEYPRLVRAAMRCRYRPQAFAFPA